MSTAPRPTKRILDDAIHALDEAVAAPIASTSAPAKRPRAMAPARQNESTPELMRLLRKQPVHSKPSRPLPDPRSLNELLDRLATFRIGGYSDAKPAALSAARAAMAGWINAADEREALACATCDAKWTMVRPGDGWRDLSTIEASVRRFIDEHRVSCPWRTRQTPETVYRLPLASPATLAAEVLERIEALRARASDLTDVRVGRSASLAADGQLDTVKAALDRHVARAATRASSDSSPSLNVELSILLLALCGWTAPSSAPSSPSRLRRSSSAASLRSLKSGLVMSCALCHRDVCTWLFTTDDRPALDPVRSHRPYCPHAVSHSEAIASLRKLGAPSSGTVGSKGEGATEHRPRGAARPSQACGCADTATVSRDPCACAKLARDRQGGGATGELGDRRCTRIDRAIDV